MTPKYPAFRCERCTRGVDDCVVEAGMKARVVTAIAGGVVALAVSIPATAAAAQAISFAAAGQDRTALIKPAGGAGAAPVVVVFAREGTSAQDALDRFGPAITRAGAAAVALNPLPCTSMAGSTCWAPMEAGDRWAVDRAAMDTLLDRLDKRPELDASRLVVLGESSGAAFAVTMTMSLPSRIDGALAVSGFDPTRAVVTDASAQVMFPLALTGISGIRSQKQRQPITVVRGSADATIPPMLSRQLQWRLTAQGWDGSARLVTVGGAPSGSAELSAPGRITPLLRDLIISAWDLDTTAGVQRRLAALGYMPSGSADGAMGYSTEQALMAFQGWEGLTRDGSVGPSTRHRLLTARRPTPQHSGKGRQIEILIGRQVMLLEEGGRVVRVVHVSTGSAGNTPRGTFSAFRKERMSWSIPFSTWMPYASYFSGGFAFHEYPDVPGYPASHGCVRVPAPYAPFVYEFARYGTPVYVR